MGITYKPAKNGEWINPKRRGYRMMCCDCGLIHEMDFRIVTTPWGKRFIQFRAFRNERATASTRRQRKRSSR